MNKLLITEINRIQELMGKPLITEITIPKELIKTLIGKYGSKMSKTVNDLLTSLKNATNNDEIANIIAKLANEDESLAKLITPKVIANLPIDSRNNIEAVKDYFDELLRKNVPVSDEQKRKTIDTFMKNNVKTELKGVNDIIRKEITDYVDELFPSKPVKKVTDLTDEIPESSISTTPSGKKRPKIFDKKTWTDKSIKVDDEIIKGLVNNKMWDKVKREFESLLTITKPRIEYIQKLAKAIETTDNSEYRSKLIPMLKKELEWVYGKQTNTFVSLRQYFDDVAKIDRDWANIWRGIKSDTDGGWDFYNVFGKLGRMSWLKRVWNGLISDIGVNFETELKISNWVLNKAGLVKKMSPESFKGNFWAGFGTGSRTGFPVKPFSKDVPKKYLEIVKKYGPVAAKSRYFRDLIIMYFKFHVYYSFLTTFRDFVTNYVFEYDVDACLKTNNSKSKECEFFTSNLLTNSFIEWSQNYRKNPSDSGDVVKLFTDRLKNIPIFSDVPNEYEGIVDFMYQLEPGLIEEVIITPFSTLIEYNQNPAKKELLYNYLDAQLKKYGEKIEETEQRIDNEVERVQDRTENIVDGITNTEQGFKNWCEANNKTFESYNKDNNGLGETTDGSFWRFKDGTFERFFTDDEKGFKDWCRKEGKPFKSYDGGYGQTTDGQLWEFNDGTFQVYI